MEETKNLEELEIERFSRFDRVVHWVVAITFIYLFLSGLGIYSPKFAWLLPVLGGLDFARWLHPWAGLVFSVGVLLMFLKWSKDFLLTSDDMAWLKSVKHYIKGEEEKLPEVGKYNAGQKVFGWLVFLGCLVFLITGILMWFPGNFPITLTRISIVLHDLAFILVGAGFIVHVYMGTVGVPGSLSGMITGKVSALWAMRHHPKWFREVVRR
ncbi:formate dehydrogenase, gamma subunit [Hydrogenobacter thermophilus TK-6]|uniref:Formate dehydrogenase gamma subunit n=1 Tax=Hydrogenobacter thermophilus (strain DSM 6534 / IAM 12695 / TK-6) TaxID=608538 RepID=D3DHT8_HYDTT|nr:formate dehydrogenase subunit gamma [Hydrogenobacter thermophilus]ADO45323.1 formate dehydrogenase, gamma subunit [Hydrogenobacter thermophilus TK-6]BAI69390.1 formate dehydrogenase gamma subunit [Hydrogenobacter thermophilus TK-6]